MSRFIPAAIAALFVFLPLAGCTGSKMPPGLEKQGKVPPGHAKKQTGGSVEIKTEGVNVKVK